MGWIRVSVSGVAAFRNEQNKAAKRITDGKLNDAAVLGFFDVVARKFDDEGPGWKTLSELRINRRAGKDHPILDWKGDLRRAATSWTDDHKGPKVDMRVSGTSTSRTWELSGEKVDNQWGGTTKVVKSSSNPLRKIANRFNPIIVELPARPFWPMDSEWEPTIDKMMDPLDAFADGWAAGSFSKFDADLRKSKSRKRTR